MMKYNNVKLDSIACVQFVFAKLDNNEKVRRFNLRQVNIKLRTIYLIYGSE